MKAATVAQLKKELQYKDSEELMLLCLRLAKFKLENKELLTYLLFEAEDEEGFITGVKETVDVQFSEINTKTYYYIKKSVRKILRGLKKYIRYSGKKETEVELLLYFCKKLGELRPSIKRNKTLSNLYERQLVLLHKKIGGLHEDLQYDYTKLLDNLK
ncbi:hypothetical protein GCM10011414_07580 [Croceivirga lutea]|uniref:hypothetical protein n=1 Tax=Croceivirga lutea TaxID=1775167 RepID=UPI00163ACBA6|nr:hypothetical protein [Croceivirga lutea]GGG40573.1 hypothetical protein GCM10011414_07580 [Croceivirga lutea]